MKLDGTSKYLQQTLIFSSSTWSNFYRGFTSYRGLWQPIHEMASIYKSLSPKRLVNYAL